MIILVCGKKQVGKDTFFNIMDIAYPNKFTRMKFAAPIYRAAEVVFGYKITEENKETEDNLLGITPRKWMQEYGDMMKRICGKNIFAELLDENFSDYDYSNRMAIKDAIVTDCRFQEEIDYMKNHHRDMVSVLINRPSNKSTDKHISERLNVKTDYVIENDSTLEAYREKVLELMRKII